jgi:hypothetical protein
MAGQVRAIKYDDTGSNGCELFVSGDDVECSKCSLDRGKSNDNMQLPHIWFLHHTPLPPSLHTPFPRKTVYTPHSLPLSAPGFALFLSASSSNGPRGFELSAATSSSFPICFSCCLPSSSRVFGAPVDDEGCPICASLWCSAAGDWRPALVEDIVFCFRGLFFLRTCSSESVEV